MESKLQELTNKIYQEGYERAVQDGKDIVDKAKAEAEQIVMDAKTEAERIHQAARHEAGQLQDKVHSELKLAGNQTVAALKQEISALISHAAFSGVTKTAFDDVAFVQELIKEIVARWDPSGSAQDLQLALPEKNRKEMEKFFAAKTQDLLKKGLTITFNGRFENGFHLGPQDGSFVLSFTDKDFTLLFQSYLKSKTREVLFPGV